MSKISLELVWLSEIGGAVYINKYTFPYLSSNSTLMINKYLLKYLGRHMYIGSIQSIFAS